MRRTSAVKPGSARHAGAGHSSKRHGKGHAPGPAAKLRRHRLRRHRLRRPPGFIDPGSSPTAINAASLMTPQMVDRLFWRAGFGPSDQDRAKWIGQPVGDRGRLDALDPRPALPASRAPTAAARSTRPVTTPTSCSAGST
jgi:hypothetical protein